jgi:hypothetical protein
MTDYNVTVTHYEEYSGGEVGRGTIALDEVQLVWQHHGNDSLRSSGYRVYLPLLKETKVRTRYRLEDGRKLRCIPISKRSDYAASRDAIGVEIGRRWEQEREREAAEREKRKHND